jgi:hypothetical protein
VKRPLQILLMVVMAVFLAEMFTPLQAADCGATVERAAATDTQIGAKHFVADDAAVAFQIHGGDKAFLDGLRAAFQDELAKKFPKAKLVDGPPPKDSVLLRLTLTSADERWTPFYSHEALGLHTVVQRGGLQTAADGKLDAVCKGLVSRGHFQAHADTLAPLAQYLVDQLTAAK